jgi:hypothetical protein
MLGHRRTPDPSTPLPNALGNPRAPPTASHYRHGSSALPAILDKLDPPLVVETMQLAMSTAIKPTTTTSNATASLRVLNVSHLNKGKRLEQVGRLLERSSKDLSLASPLGLIVPQSLLARADEVIE